MIKRLRRLYRGVIGLVDIQKKGTVIFFAPVEKQYFSKWEYYQVDLEMLELSFSEVIVCHSYWVLIKALLFRRPRLVYCWWWHRSAICVLLSRLFRVPVYITGAVHMYDESGAPDFFSKSVIYKLACRISWRLATRNLFISKSQYRQICSHEKIHNPSVLMSSLRHSYKPVKISESMPIRDGEVKISLLTIVWMTKYQLKRKSIFETLEGLALLLDSGVTNFEWIIGGGKDNGSAMLEDRINQLKLENHVFMRFDLSDSEKSELYGNADLYIQPSYYEGFGNAVLEAMSFGVPAVVSRNTAQAEVIGDSGLVVEEIDAESIAHTLEKYIKFSSAERFAMRTKVHEVISDRHLFERRLQQFIVFNELDELKS